MSGAEIEDFAGYCHNATNNHLYEIFERERRAGRNVSAFIARAEALTRGLDTGDWPPLTAHEED